MTPHDSGNYGADCVECEIEYKENNMGCGQSAARDDYIEFQNWVDNLSEGESKLIDIRRQLLKTTNELAFKRDQMKEIDEICNNLLKITGGQRHKYELDN